jgi:aryl-alcohol dehydrogenase-like predicted oxidoreductase
MNKRLALGTAQFGLPYGVANHTGQIGRHEAGAILAHARDAGIDTLDTAMAYGESELRLGEVDVEGWQVISKLSAIPPSCPDVAAWVQESVVRSLARLRIPRLSGLLLHRPQELLGEQGQILYRALSALKEQGLVAKIGVSIYGPEELDALCPYFRFDLVQAPFNIVDRRMATSGWLKKLHQSGTEVHIRSAFLQGLLLMGEQQRPLFFQRWQPLWKEWHRWLVEQALSPLQACLGFVLAQPEVGRVVLGIDSLEHLRGILASAGALAVVPPTTLASQDLNLINPARWSLT